jgi:hypothetical protein
MFSGTVRALRRGYAGGKIRETDDIFPFNGPLGSWMEPVSGDEAEKPRRGRPKHTTSAASIDEKPLHRDAQPDVDGHESQVKE